MPMKYLRVLCALALTSLAATIAVAQPSNNDFVNAWILTGAVVTTNGNSGEPSDANKEAGEPNHAGFNGGRSVWFNWTAPASGQIRIDTAGSDFNTLLAVYTGAAVNALTPVAANDNAPGLGSSSLVEFLAAAGTTYRIAVDGHVMFGGGFQFPASGPYVLNLTMLASVNITSPTNGSVIYAGTPIPITVEAGVPNEPVTRVDFYQADDLIGSDSTAPFSITLTNASLGTNRFFVVAVDNASLSWTSRVVNVAVLDLGVTILSPAEGSIFLNTNPITVRAVASLPSGTITNVEFFADGQKFGEDARPPFSAVWRVSGGVHRLTARGQDNGGILYTSTPVAISIPRAILPTGSVWKYLDDGSDQGTNWIAPGFDDSSWASGPAELGYGDGDEVTVVGFGPEPDNKYITTYFRHAFFLPNAASYTNFILRLRRDDGGVVYLNGVEVQRVNMPFGPVSYLSRAALAGDDGNSFSIATISSDLIVEGRNVLAVEIHQNLPTTDDMSFDFQLQGVLKPENQPPIISVVSPTNNASFLAPSAITIEASASDSDGSVAKVVFFADGISLGEDTNSPYSLVWDTPPIGWHLLQAVATDDIGSSALSPLVSVIVYDAVGTPLTRITSPAEGAVAEGPTNMVVTADASALTGVTNVQFLANGSPIGSDATSPYSIVWDAPFGSNALTTVAFDAAGKRGTSAVVNVVITIPPTNTVAPTVSSQTPAAGALVTALNTIRVIFSERVSGVDASDLLVNGEPAIEMIGDTSNYVFTVIQPGYGTVNVSWAANHGIADFGFPSSLPFDENGPDASWTYDLVDRTPPTIAVREPVAGATVTNLTEIAVTFTEPVNGVDAADFLINGTAAFGLSGGGSNYTFSFSQPSSGLVNITWANDHGIGDLAPSPNAFNATGAGATWSYTLDTRTILVQSNSTWLFLKGTTEASAPVDAWRQLVFDDSNWSNSLAPFYFGDPYNSAANPGTLLSDMLGGYTSIYLRKTFQVANAGLVTNLLLNAQSDDGFIAWINGVEVARVNVAGGDTPYNGTASGTAQEPAQSGAAYNIFPLPNPSAYVVDGANVLAVHAFNQSLAQSTDFGFNAQLYTFLFDPSAVAPRIASVTPAAGTLFHFTNIAIRFTEPVGSVDANDLLINGTPATSVSGGTSNSTYTFQFAQPAYGPVSVTWVSDHDIVDFDASPKPFDGMAPGSVFQYTLLNPSTPTVISQTPLAGAIINGLTQLSVTFSEPVTGVNASDLVVNGVAATGVSGSGANYTFTFNQPEYGAVSIGWAPEHGITDLELPANAFEVTREGSTWNYTLVDQTAPSIAALNPPAGAQVTNLTQITLTFSEPVTGVNASDLQVNGAPATSVSGGPSAYAFSFPQPNATVVNFTWANAHGIRDSAPVPNSFDATAPNAIWSYATPDNVAPALANIEPSPFVTVRSLSQIRMIFTEAVTGVDTNDLLINGGRALSVGGSGSGPYTFNFLSPSNGVVDIRWAEATGIRDLAVPPNDFGGGTWTYTLDPAATFAGKVLINEIMFNAADGPPANEWIELHNITASPINLAGWRFTRGVDFVLPNVSIAANGYLVVAADVNAFQSNYPDVAAVIGGWSGRLANSDETIELETALGEIVNSVHYATEGDWARRERGHGAQLVTSIVRNGNTATVTIFDHGFTAGGGGGGGGGADQILISGADQPEYNGLFTINGVSASTFNFTVDGEPASPATGTIIARHIVDNGASGWSWFSAADGFGNSLELVNPLLPNTSGQNWLSSMNAGGTPGAANSVANLPQGGVAPLILDVTHFPPVPRSTDPVAITARVRDELSNGVASVTLFYRNHTTTAPGAFSSTNMFDDGAHGDGLNGDGLFGAVLSAFANGTVIEFYVQASDTDGNTRTWPAPTWNTDNTFGQLANALYQVDDEVIPNPMPIVRIVLSGSERAVFPPGNRQSDAEANNTFISTDGDGTKIRYLAGVRVRGAGSRTRNPPNNRLNIPNDNRWNGLQAVNLNGQFVHAQVMGAAVAQKSGVPSSPAHVIQYRINGVNPAPITAPVNDTGNGAGYGAFVMVQPVNGDLADALYPEDGDGNVYRASMFPHDADLNYQGTNPVNYRVRGYFKSSNQTENDWSDMFALTFAFSQVASDADYLQAMSTNVNVEVWMRYFALGTLLNYGETAMFNGRGDDYALYRGIKDPRFVPIGHDFDTIFGQGDAIDDPPGTGNYALRTNASIYIMLNPPNTGGGNAPNMPLLRRFFTNEHFAPVFYAELKHLCDTVFSPEELNSLFDQMLNGWGNGPTTVTIDMMKTHAQNRRSVVLSQIPLTLTVSNTLTSASGFLFTTTPNVTLFGSSHAIDTRQVLVNGIPSGFVPWDARWTNTTTLQPGINRVLVQSLNSNNVEFARQTVDIWYDDGSLQSVSGAIGGDIVWTAAEGPYQVTANVTVSAGATLTIQAGTSVYLSPGANITIANGGRLVAEGADVARIRFANAPGAGNWGGLTINGGPDSPETRIAYAHFEGNNSAAVSVIDGTAFLDHLTFGNTTRRYLNVDRASFVVQDCVFPTATAAFEPVHGSGGLKAGGRGIFLRNFFGRVNGYNDSLDFTGGNRPGPILQVINNVFMGSDDDLLDLDSTDAWVEGNIFLHTHRNGSPDSASAISGGTEPGLTDTSEITVIGNLFYDVDHAVLAKQDNFYTIINNTIVHQTRTGSQDTNTAVVILADDDTTQGAGLYIEGNIILDAENLTRNLTTALVTYTNNLIHQLQGAPWNGPGGANIDADPLLKHIPSFSETMGFNSWAAAQVMWDYFSLKPGSPAQDSGPNGHDLGAVDSSPSPLGGERAGVKGATLSGEPVGTTPLNSATLHVGVNRTGHGIPTAGFPDGSGYTHYRWRLDGGAWSAETPTATPITLNGLSSGPHYVEAVGRRDSGFYQDDPVYGSDAIVTVSRIWTVNPNASSLRLNELLASNAGSVNHSGTTPDVVELHNASDVPFALTGVRLTDDLNDPDKFIFPAGADIPPRGYLVVYANDPDGTAGYHLGFGLNEEGDSLYLFAAAANGGALLDSISFGPQLPDLSIGRLAEGEWALAQPTLGAANRAAPTGDPRALRINEWLAIAQTPFNSDFVELYNSDPLPVSLSGLYLSDELIGWRDRHQMPALSFIAGHGHLRLFADGDTSLGATHLSFALSGDEGAIALYLPDLAVIDCVWYQPQQPNISQGRSPSGAAAVVFFETPTPGAPNPIVTGPTPFGGALVINEVLANNASLAEPLTSAAVPRTPDWVELYNGTTNTIDVGGLSLTDDAQQPRRFVFPPATMLPPAGYVRVFCDNGEPATTNNTGFGLAAAGGSVYLFDAPGGGGSLLSAVTYGIQTPDLSIGRAPDGSTNWALTTPTPNAANSAIPTLGNVENLSVNEWLADPLPGDDDWFEIYNSNPLPVALGGLHLTDDLNDRTKHRIPALSFVGVGANAWQTFVADGNTGGGADHANFSLRGAGEAIGISAANGVLIDGISFAQQEQNISEGRFPDGDTAVVKFPGTGSPGASNWRLLSEIAINEVLTHTELPLEDAIELQNLTDQPIDVGGWWLSDDDGTLQKYQIPPPTVLPPNGFVVIYETAFTNAELTAIPFALSSRGDEVVLSAATNNALTGYRARVDFGAQANGVSFGRYLTSEGRAEFVPMAARTFGVDDPSSGEEFRMGAGETNTYPRVGPVVISEIMYHPPDLGTNDNTRDEFIELRNITTTPVFLYDSMHPTNRWRLRNAVDFDFAPGTVIAPGDSLLVVGFDPVNNPTALAAFRGQYNLDASVAIAGPWIGRLANDTDDVELRRPDLPDTNDVPYVLVERVRYVDAAPWPAAADGTGFSLQRVAESEFGNDPVNWLADAPTPGPAASSGDTDGDGLPDAWENLYGFDPFNPADAALDSDGDGLTNLQEFHLGTDPRNPASGLRLNIALAPDGASVLLSFVATAEFAYTLEYSDTLGASWQSLQSFPAAATNHVVQLAVSATASTRFYRLRTDSGSEPGALRLNFIQVVPGNQVALAFSVPANRSCEVLFTPNLAGTWTAVTNYAAAATNRVLRLITPSPGTSGFYRLRSP